MAGKVSLRGFEIVKASRDLLQVVATLGLTGSFARRLNGRQQHRHEQANDRNDDQELDEREPGYFFQSRSCAVDRVRPASESISLIDSMLHRSCPRLPIWLHGLMSDPENARTGSGLNVLPQGVCRITLAAVPGGLMCGQMSSKAEL